MRIRSVTLRAGIVGLLCCATPVVAQTFTDSATLEVVYTADLAANVSGGLTRDVVYMDNVDVTLSMDGAALGWDGTTLFLYGLGNQGGSISELVGDVQGVSNIEAPTSWRLYEAWVEQLLFSHRLSLLAGLYDLSSEFDVIHTASVFLHSSPGTGPDLSQSGQNGPSIFPVTSLGGRLRLSVNERLVVKAALLDGVPGDPERPRGTHIVLDKDDGVLLAAEAVVLIGDGATTERRTAARRRLVARNADLPEYAARFGVGGWMYTSAFPEVIDPNRPGPAALLTDSRGAYAFGEWNVIREAADRNQGLAVFARAGVANDRINRFGSYFGLGAVYTGLFAKRNHDKAGATIAIASNGDPYMAAYRGVTPLTRSEVALEATYLAQIIDWLAIQGSLQYVINPDTDESIDNALVPILRVQIAP